jgi:sulfatase maturation enzyme AslB (radical SAM superfamily)
MSAVRSPKKQAGEKISWDTLMFVVTYACNLRCRYCPTTKAERQMSWDVARAALDRFLDPEVKTIRFFGSEPLLNFAVIRKIVDHIAEFHPSLHKRLRYELTTNGTLLTEEHLVWLHASPQVALTVSIDGTGETHRHNRRPAQADGSLDSYAWVDRVKDRLLALETPVTVNITVPPDKASMLFRNFSHIVKLGFRKVNFLPAYYTVWEGTQIRELEQQLRLVARFVTEAWQRDVPLVVRNLFAYSNLTLFNEGLIVDWDGSLYTENLIMTRYCDGARERLRIGSVAEDLKVRHKIDIDHVLRKNLSEAALDSTRAVDGALSAFVEGLYPHFEQMTANRGGRNES